MGVGWVWGKNPLYSYEKMHSLNKNLKKKENWHFLKRLNTQLPEIVKQISKRNEYP